MEELREVISDACSVVLEPAAEEANDDLLMTCKGFAEEYRKIEAMLSTGAEEIGIRGVTVRGIHLGYYMHISAQLMPIDVLYRYDEEKVYIETLTMESRLRLAS